jgi:hypothetical protein
VDKNQNEGKLIHTKVYQPSRLILPELDFPDHGLTDHPPCTQTRSYTTTSLTGTSLAATGDHK